MDRNPDLWDADILYADTGIIEEGGFAYQYRNFQSENAIEISRGSEYYFLVFYDNAPAKLFGIRSHKNRFLEGDAATEHMVKAALRLAKERGISQVQIDDDVKKRLDNDSYFHLSDMHFLTTGYTWYESLNIGIYPRDIMKRSLELYRDRVRTNTWASVAARLHIPPELSIDISDIDVTAPGSAMTVLQRIRDIDISFFAKYNLALPVASGIYVHFEEWVADL